MAGIAKPDIEGLGKEGEIEFKYYDGSSGRDSIDTLLDEKLDKHGRYGVLLSPYGATYIEFELKQPTNLWSYGQRYSDSGGYTTEPISLVHKQNGEWKVINPRVPTKDNEWYLLGENLEVGEYRIKSVSRYTMFTEWYIENLERYKFLIKQNNQYYTVKTEHYSNGQFQPLTLEGGTMPNETDYENFGFDDINDLLIPQNTEIIQGIDKGELGEGKYFEIELDNEVKKINNIE